MSDSMASPSVMIISDDLGLVDSLVKNNKTGQEFFSHESVLFILDEPAVLDNNSIVIFDIETNDNNLDTAIDQILRIKQLDPTQILILTGESEALSEVLKSSIQPLVYRAFTKPVSANQVFLAFKSGNRLHYNLVEKQAAGFDITVVGPAENKTNVASLLGERKSNSATYLMIGMMLIAVAAWLLLSNDDVLVTEFAVSESMPLPEPAEELVPAVNISVQRINQLNQLAANALLEERVIAPQGTSALDYYDQVLAIDPYDTTAYQGKKEISDRLRHSYQQLETDAEFDQALKVINLLEQLEPLNLQNDSLRGGLEKAINSHVEQIQKNGSTEEIAKTTEVLEKIENDLTGSKSAINSLQAEKEIIATIDSALDQDRLFPPAKDNAYSLVSASLKANTVSNANISPRVKGLSAKLLRMAKQSAAQDDLEEAAKLAALIKRLNVDRQGLEALNTLIGQRTAALMAAANKAVVVEEVVPEPAKIIPAKIIARASPRYPNRALSQNVEGWVELSFQVNEEGLPFNIAVLQAEPTGMFESSALKAVKKWRFTPARNEKTGLPVRGEAITTKVSFKFDS